MKTSNIFVYPHEGNMYINLTNNCTNSCSFCLRANDDGIHGNTLWLHHEPTAQEVIKQIEAANFNYNQVVFCGYGEPTMRLEQLIEVAEYLKKKGLYVRLNTNGHSDEINKNSPLLNQQKNCTAALIAPFIDEVSISLNASNAQDYDNICLSTYGKDGFSYMIKFASSCVSYGIKTTLSVVDVIGNIEVEKCRIIAKDIGATLKVRTHIKNNAMYR